MRFLAFAALIGLACLVSSRPGFSYLRLMCQAIFGEGVLFGLGLVWAHASQGCRRAWLPVLATVALLATYWEAYHREPHDLQLRFHEVKLGPGPPRERLRILHMTDAQTHALQSAGRRDDGSRSASRHSRASSAILRSTPQR